MIDQHLLKIDTINLTQKFILDTNLFQQTMPVRLYNDSNVLESISHRLSIRITTERENVRHNIVRFIVILWRHASTKNIKVLREESV